MTATVRFARASQTQPAGVAGWLMQAARLLLSRSSTQRGRAKERQLKLVETLSLGGRKQLLLVSCAGETFLVGAGEDCVQTIVRVAGAANSQAEENIPCS